jgi:hypothetical protein
MMHGAYNVKIQWHTKTSGNLAILRITIKKMN